MKSIFLISFFIFITLIDFSQKKNYEIIAENVTHYEFNKARDKIYYLIDEEYLFPYDIRSDETTEIKLSENKFRFYELYVSETDTLYIRSAHNQFFKVFEDKYVEFIPYILEGKAHYHPMRIDKEEFQYIEKFLNVPNTKIEKIDEKYYILTPHSSKKGEKRSICDITLSYMDNTKLAEKTTSQAKDIKYIQNTDYQYEKTDKKNKTNYFRNNNIVIIEKDYFCQLIYVFSQSCKYKITVKTPNQKIVFKTKSWAVNSYLILSNSKFISDYNKNIYLLFPIGSDTGIHSLIKIK